jgi:uncharacterized membrane protein YphA (DoxX/SURF4 family)
MPLFESKKLKRLIVVIFLFITVYFFLFSHYSLFLLSASYDDLKVWYPNYYKEIYLLIKPLHIGAGIVLLYFILSLVCNFSDLIKLVKKIFSFIKVEKDELINGYGEKKYSCNYRIYFWVLQVLLLFFTLIVYFFINRFSGAQQAFIYQLYLSRAYLLLALNGVVLFLLLNRQYFISVALKFLISPSAPYNLAVYRILFFGLLVKEYLILLGGKLQFIESKPREGLPFIGWLIDIMPITPELYYYACIAGIVCCIFLILGLFTRASLFVNAILVFYIIAVPNFYGKLWHSQLSIWISWFLLFAPISDVFSLDKLFFNRTKPLVKSPEYTFPIKIIWLQIGFIYFWAGFHKLSDGGFDWALSQSMVNQVRLEWFESFDKLPFYRIDLHPWLLYAGGMLVIFFELGFWAFLFHRRYKYVSIAGGLLMHNLINAFMYIGFRELQLQYIVFLNFEKALLFLKKSIPKLPVEDKINVTNSSLRTMPVVVSFFILGMNFIFGLFQISSFPFSVYPTYVEIIPSEKEYLHYSVVDAGKETVDVWDLGKKSNFNWESFTRLEYAIIRKYNETSKVDTQAVYNQWKWWTTQLPQLKDIDSIDVYIYKRSLNPDSAKIILDKRYLLRLHAEDN